jgi:hypothetical protein
MGSAWCDVKRKAKANGKASGSRRGQKPLKQRIHDRVRSLMAGGASEDLVADELGLDKNQLRRKYIRPLAQGREARRQQIKAERDLQTKKEMELYLACMAGFDSKWTRPDGTNRLHLNKTREECEADFVRLRASLRKL